MEIKKTYKTTEIDDHFRFSEVINMSLNEVLLRILEDKYGFYYSTKDYDIVWFKNSMTIKWVHIENKLV